MRPMIIAGNWKMNNVISDSLKLVAVLERKLKAFPENVEVVIAPPFTALSSVNITTQDTSIKLCGQNIHWEDAGAFTGEISGAFLKDAGCSYVIIGHSERRKYFGETDENVNKKILAALRNELIPIVCVGETLEERTASKQEEVVESQIKKAFFGLPVRDAENLVIAYEPVWAIGTGRTATPAEAQQMHRFIRNLIEKTFDSPTANKIRILYGGSVSASNSAELLTQRDIDGALVGGASLKGEEFAEIILATPHKSL